MLTKIKCILIDDELLGLTYLKMLCEQIPELEVVKVYNDSSVFLKEMENLVYDLCILDIEMPSISGIQLANLLSDKWVIFTTAYKNYAFEAFELNAIDYISKPVKKDRLLQAIQKIVKLQNALPAHKDFFHFNTDKGKALIHFDKINFIRTSEVDSRDKMAFMDDGDNLLLKNVSFNQLNDFLPSQSFAQINKGEIIALKIIKLIFHDELTSNLSDENHRNLTFTIGEKFKEDLMKKTSI